KRETVFHCTCTNGYRSVVVQLLQTHCDTTIRNDQLYNDLELAIINYNKDVNAQMIPDSNALAVGEISTSVQQSTLLQSRIDYDTLSD
ncbi:unnamed protein product, partial [Rotaria magnacalcarata]